MASLFRLLLLRQGFSISYQMHESRLGLRGTCPIMIELTPCTLTLCAVCSFDPGVLGRLCVVSIGVCSALQVVVWDTCCLLFLLEECTEGEDIASYQAESGKIGGGGMQCVKLTQRINSA